MLFLIALPLTADAMASAGINCCSTVNLAPPRLQQLAPACPDFSGIFRGGVCGSEFVTRHPVSIKIFIIHLVPAMSSDDMF